MTRTRISKSLARRILQHSETRGQLGWMHPSMRDLLIGYLMQNERERRSFLERCGPDGFALAVSAAGGAEGERRFPLLRAQGDWQALERRCGEIIIEADEPALGSMTQALIEAVEALTDEEATGVEGGRLGDLCRRFAHALKDRLDGAVIPIDLIESYVSLTLTLEPLEPMPDLTATWDALRPNPESQVAEEEVSDLYDWLEFVSLIWRTEPRFLAQLDFDTTYGEVLRDCLDAAEAALDGTAKIEEEDPFANVLPGEDPHESSDYSNEEEGEADWFAEIEDTLEICDPQIWAAFGLLDRVTRLQARLDEQRTIREERTRVWEATMRPEPDYDEMRERYGYREHAQGFDVSAIFVDL